MTIHHFGGEMGFFKPSDSASIEVTDQSHNSAFARCAMRVRGTTSYIVWPVLAAPVTSGWWHFDYKRGAGTGGTNTKIFVGVDDNGDEVIRVLAPSTSMVLQYWDGTTWVDLSATISVDTDSIRQTIDIYIEGMGSSDGYAELYIAGNLRANGEADFTTVPNIEEVRQYGRGATSDSVYSQCIAADESTIGMRVGTIAMTGNGNSTAWTGDYTGIDETAYLDADLIVSPTADQVELFTGTAVPSFTGYRIRALALTARAKKSGSGPEQFQFALRSAGTTYFSSTIPLTFGYENYCAVWATDPATSAEFLSTAIASLQFGVKSIT